MPASRRVRPADGLVIHVSALIDEQPRFPRGFLPRTPIEATVLDLVDAARGIDEARGGVVRACGRGLTSEDRLRAAMRGRRRLRWRQIAVAAAAAAPTAGAAPGAGAARMRRLGVKASATATVRPARRPP